MNKLFQYQENNVRTQVDETGEIWFAGIDVCTILGYADPTQTIEKLDEDEKKLDRIWHGSGQSRKAWTVNEFGLYSLILTSTKPEAKAFKRWLTHEVLPALRKAGKYTNETQASKELAVQELIKNIEYAQERVNDCKSEAKSWNLKQSMLEIELRQVLKQDVAQTKMYPADEMEAMKVKPEDKPMGLDEE